jgi:hypothetical protein
MNPKLKDENKLTHVATAITLDANGELPTRFALFVTGNWDNSVKGNFKVTLDDLKQMQSNFQEGIGFPTEDASTGLAIDYKHEYYDEAAAWIKGLELQVDPKDSTKGTLFANPVEWTPQGQEAIQSGRFKCVSPMGSFGTKNGKQQLWANPTNLKERFANVLEGAGLTNIPFLRGMAPIRADKLDETNPAYDKVVFVYDLQQKPKEQSMNIDELRIKERTELSVPELDFLVENKEKLSAQEVTKFKLTAAAEEEGHDELSTEDKETLAAIKAGNKKVVDASSEIVEKTRLDALEATANEYRDEKIQTVLDKHIKRGALKQDQTDFWKGQLLSAADEKARKGLEEALEALPSNELLAKTNGTNEIGTGEDVSAGATAREQFDALAKNKVSAAAKEGKELLYADALKQVVRENKDLSQQDLKEQGIS